MNPTSSQDLNSVNAQLAAELAAGLLPVPDILHRYEKTPAQLKQLLKDPMFSRMVSDFAKEWNSPLTAKERIRMKSLIAVEDSLSALYAMFHNPANAPPARLEAFKQLAELADAKPKKDAAADGSRFSVTFNIPASPTAPRESVSFTVGNNEGGLGEEREELSDAAAEGRVPASHSEHRELALNFGPFSAEFEEVDENE